MALSPVSVADELDLFRPDPHEQAEADRLLREGLMRPLIRDVLVSARAPDCPQVRARGVQLCLAGSMNPRGGVAASADPSTARVGYATAAWVHAGGEPPQRLDVVITPGSTRLRVPALRLHEHRLADDDVVSVAGLWVTSPVRTAVDVIRGLTLGQARPTLDRLALRAGVRPVDVLTQLDVMPHGRGVARARGLVHAWAAELASR